MHETGPKRALSHSLTNFEVDTAENMSCMRVGKESSGDVYAHTV